MTDAEIVASTTAVLGLVIASLSTLAAFRSAASAQSAQKWAAESAHLAATIAASKTATEVLVEVQRTKALAEQATTAYQTLEVFSGSYQNAGIHAAKANVHELARQAEDLSETARLFVDAAVQLVATPLDEVARVQIKLSASHANVVALRIELEQIVMTVEAQNSQYRERALAR